MNHIIVFQLFSRSIKEKIKYNSNKVIGYKLPKKQLQNC